MDAAPAPIRVDTAFDDPKAILDLVRRNGPYPAIASYLPPSATRPGSTDGAVTAPWFRANWAVAGRATVAAADSILGNERFASAAARLFAVDQVRPTTVVVNVNAPMPAGAVHVDIPSFAGANRDQYPLQLLQAMGTSGLFEPWRVVEAGAVCWFYDGPGGAYDYWPDGLDGAMRSERPPFSNRALVADNDRMYHRIGVVGDARAAPRTFPASARIAHRDGGGWVIEDGGAVLAAYPDEEVRVSILWKAQVGLPEAAEPLRPDLVASIFAGDLATRGVDIAPPASPLTDEAWIARLHETYYPIVSVDG